MIRNEVFANGVCVAAQIVDLGAGTLTVEDHGVVVSSRALTSDEIVAWTPPPPTDAERLAAATADRRRTPRCRHRRVGAAGNGRRAVHDRRHR